ncbi:hypothetical protein EDB89DRAFT_2224074 [Lactarius sanguifluus]|nr:hypothetical protein EDB89DRAFT_2224074 [Lactarius sanguifluus]
MNIEYHLSIPQKAPPFEIEKQRIEIPKLRAMLDTLLANGRLVHGTKLTTELLTFASRMEERLAIETARMTAAEEAELDPLEPQGSTVRTYLALRDAAAARPGMRQLVHLADMQRSVQRNLARKTEGTPVRWSKRSLVTDEEDNETGPEEQRIAELKARSLFAPGSRSISDPMHVDLYGSEGVERPSKVLPATHIIHDDILTFVRTGKLPEHSTHIVPLFAPTDIDKALDSTIEWSPSPLATADFATTTEYSNDKCLTDYLRPVSWGRIKRVLGELRRDRH